ncbi:hypothetical protein [Streptomyces sp. NPDC059080]|uniref:hypothetical protein n=1 Tax=Streptomyces sp. NPDC059080 TaxID=3346718 RepID=UPI00369B5756
MDPVANPYEFARVDVDDCVAACRRILARPGPHVYEMPEWACYEQTMRILPGLVEDMAQGHRPVPAPVRQEGPRPLDIGRHPKPVAALLEHYGLTDAGTFLQRADQLGLLSQSDPGERRLLRDLHNELFTVMESETAHVGGDT